MSDKNVSRWTLRRRLLRAGRGGGESDLSSSSSSSDSDRERPPLQRQRVQESSPESRSNESNNEDPGEISGEESGEDSREEGGEDLEEGAGNEAGEALGEEAREDLGHRNEFELNHAADQEGGVQLQENASSSSDSEESSSSSEEDSSESEADESDHGDNEEGGVNGDGPLYENSRITHMESIIMILTFALTFSLSGQCLAHLLELIEIHCPLVNRCTTTLYKFKKIFHDIGRNVLVLHYFCENCFKNLARKDSVCTNCEADTQVGFFIEVPFINQLQRMFLRPGFVENLSYRFNRQKKHEGNIEDIYDGRLYKDHMRNNGLLNGIYNLSFMFYTDGISVFKSSKFSIWPLFFVINELNYKVRTQKENIILAGLWFGKRKPRPNLFLRPFRNLFNTFQTDGFELNIPRGQPVTVKGILLCGTCDLQAKGVFLCMKQSNGYYGCSKCNSSGERVPAGRTTVHVHRFIRAEHMQLRNENNIPAYARSKMLGFKGLSVLYVLMPSMLRGVAIDVMHMIFIGISKLLNKFWFDPTFAGEPYSCCRLVDVVNERLNKIEPPSFVQRFTRNLSDLKLWKAKEYKLWFFYYSAIVMNGVLENVYLHHYLKLVTAISLLSQESIFPEQIDAADALLNEYVRDFQALYTLRFMGMNVHLLLHVADVVRDLGPLWVYSCFFLEDLNGQLGKLIHGPHQVGLQVCSSSSLFLSLKTQIDILNPMSIAKQFCVNLRSLGIKYKTVEVISDKMNIVGRSAFDFNVSIETKEIIRNQFNLEGGHYQLFSKLRKSGVVLTCEAKVTRTKRCSMYAVFHTDNGNPILGKIKEFVRFSPCMCNRVCLCLPAQYFCIVQKYERIPWHAHNVQNVRIAYLTAVQPTDNFIAIECRFLESVCFYMNVDNVEYLAIPINKLEYE